MLKRFISLVRAEYMFVAAEIIRRKTILFALILWPYIIMAFIVLLGSSMGTMSYFQQKIGANPILFFITGSFLLIVSLIFFDEISSRFWYDEFIGTLPYIMIAPTSKTMLALAMGFPRLIINILVGLSSLIPVYFILKSFPGLVEALIVIALSIFSALTFSTLAIIFSSLVLISGGRWRVLSIIRPLIMLISGVLYPRFLLPLTIKFFTIIFPLANSVEAIQLFLVQEGLTAYSLMLLGLATALALLYAPVSIRSLRIWEHRILIKGAKT
ncbi:MAG: ABC transporter permease [Thermoprotei archaeon]|nr:MAG: ABC transporter permease [Thermoprotei archaeon]